MSGYVKSREQDWDQPRKRKITWALELKAWKYF